MSATLDVAPMPPYVVAWAIAFALTQVIETPLYRWLAPVRWREAFMPSLVTHPPVWFAIVPGCVALGAPVIVAVIVAELIVWAIEAWVLTRFGIATGRAIVIALIANGASVVGGELVRALLGPVF